VLHNVPNYDGKQRHVDDDNDDDDDDGGDA